MLPVLPVLLLACAPVDGDALRDVEVVEAHLEEVALGSGALLGGTWGGDALLVLGTAAGEELRVPVDLRGSVLGLGLELALQYPAFPVTFQLPEVPLQGDRLVGRYRGNTSAMAAVAGVQVHHLENREGVRVDAAFVPIGVSMMVGFEWLRLEVAGPVQEPWATGIGDTGAAVDTGEGGVP